MKHFYIFLLSTILLNIMPERLLSQNCSSGTPLFYVDLTGQPNGVWQSPPILRGGDCCGTDNNCIEFIVTLDSMATGILFNIAAGAMPGGALYYQVNCGPLTSIGTPVCLDGPGPHDITFCKPGNNLNVYEIASIPIPEVTGTEWVSEVCSGSMSILGLDSATTVWSSIPPNPIYNGYLSCTSGCNNVTINPIGVVPPYIDYQVCGYPIGGCYTTPFCDTMRVNFVNSLAVGITPQDPVICFGAPPTLVTANVSGGNDPYNVIWSTGATTPSISVSAGTYYVSVTDSMNCSVATDSVVVTAMASTIVASAGPDQILCLNNSSTQLNGSVIAATGGQWYGGSGIFSPGITSLNAMYTPTQSEINNGSVQLSLITAGNNTCPSDTDQVMISLSPNPTPQLQGLTTVCEYSTGTYSTPFTTGNSYIWNVAGGTVLNTVNNSITVQWGAAGSGNITVTEANALLCDSAVTLNMVIAPQPVPVINGTLIVCTTTTTSYTIASPFPGNTYSWTVTGGTITGSPNGTSINVEWTLAGTATISLTESNSLGCDSTVSVTATVLTIPTPEISGPDTVCALHTFVYSTVLVSGNTYSWNVTGGTVIANNNNSITVAWPANGNGSITLTESNTLACATSVSTHIFMAPQPFPVINGSLTSCTGTYSQFSINNATSGNTYSWSITGGTISGPANGTSITVFWTNSGTATLSFTESNNFGCDSTVSAIINILQRPAPEISGPPIVCDETLATYSVSSYIPTHTYYWSVTNGTIIGLNVGNRIDVLWSSPGAGSVTLRQVSSNGCDSTTSTQVMINPLPAPAITGPPTSCENEPGIYSSIQVPGNTYQWATIGGIINGSSTDSQITISWASGPIASVYLTETTPEGCSRFIQFPVQIRNKPEPGILGSMVGCIGTTQNSYSTMPEPDINYQWSVSGGIITSGNGTSNVTVQWQNAGSQTITLSAANVFTGCDSSVTFNVQTGALPEPVIQGPALSGCIPFTANFNGNIVNPAYNYSWSFGDGTSGNGANPSHEYNQPGTYEVQLIATNSTGCADTVMAQVTSFPVPEASFSLWHGTDVYYANISTMTLTNLSTGGAGYFWTFGNNDHSQEFEPQYQYTEPGHYTIALTVTNQYGCRDITSKSLTVKLPEDLYIPNAFTPNGDNKNDHFSVVAYNINKFRINIFNRWGRIIYTSTDPTFIWDGKHNGSDVMNGVYVYTVEATGMYGTDFNFSGTVTLVK